MNESYFLWATRWSKSGGYSSRVSGVRAYSWAAVEHQMLLFGR